MNTSASGAGGVQGAILRVVEAGPRAFRLVGELDVSNTGPLSDLLAAELLGPGDFTLDLSGLTFMDSAGIHLFIKTATALTGRGNLLLLNPVASIARIIDTTGLERLDNLVVVYGPGQHPG